MKKVFFISIAIIMLLLVGCEREQDGKYTITKDDNTYIVDTGNQIISYDNEIYEYEVDGGTYEITYPDKSTYWWTQEENAGFGGWSDDHDESKYAQGEVLVDLLLDQYDSKNTQDNLLVIVILMGIGILNIVSPYSSWYLSYGWRYKDVEPSKSTLVVARFSGVIIIILTIAYIWM